MISTKWEDWLIEGGPEPTLELSEVDEVHLDYYDDEAAQMEREETL